MSDGHYAEIKEVLTKGPMARWLEEEEMRLVARARPSVDNAVYNDAPCPDDCQEECQSCPRHHLHALLAIKSWEIRN